jgi:hypothetical protein
MKEPALLECYNEYPKATEMSMMVFAALWPLVSVIDYFVHGLKK